METDPARIPRRLLTIAAERLPDHRRERLVGLLAADGRTIKRWRDQIVAWHRFHVSNGPTEAVNNLVKRVKRVAHSALGRPASRRITRDRGTPSTRVL